MILRKRQTTRVGMEVRFEGGFEGGVLRQGLLQSMAQFLILLGILCTRAFGVDAVTVGLTRANSDTAWYERQGSIVGVDDRVCLITTRVVSSSKKSAGKTESDHKFFEVAHQLDKLGFAAIDPFDYLGVEFLIGDIVFRRGACKIVFVNHTESTAAFVARTKAGLDALGFTDTFSQPSAHSPQKNASTKLQMKVVIIVIVTVSVFGLCCIAFTVLSSRLCVKGAG